MSEFKKKVKPGAIELHPTEEALLVHCEIQEVEQAQDGSTIVHNRTQTTKKVAVKALAEHAAAGGLSALASEIIEKCKLIHQSKLPLVEALLQQLLDRGTPAADSTASERHTSSATSSATSRHNRERGSASPLQLAQPTSPLDTQPPGSPTQQSVRSHSSRTPSQTIDGARSPSSTQVQQLGSKQQRGKLGRLVAAADAAIAAEDDVGGSQQAAGGEAGAGSTVVALMQMPMMLPKQYEPARLEDLELYIEQLYEDVLAHVARAAGMIAQLFRRAALLPTLLDHGGGCLPSTLARLLREQGKRSPELAANIVAAFCALSCFSQFHGLISSYQVGLQALELVDLEIRRSIVRAAEDPSAAPAAVAQRAMEATSGRGPPLTDRERKAVVMLQRQDRLLHCCLALLLNLAEDPSTERKMKNKNIVGLLIAVLERSNVELLALAATFLRRLSVYQENKSAMAAAGAVPWLLRLVPARSAALLAAVLRLLHNLSFDAGLREQMVTGGLIQKALPLIDAPGVAPVVLGLLYHMSVDERARHMFVYAGAVAPLADMLLRAQDLRAVPELTALVVNLTDCERAAGVICDAGRLEKMLRRALATADELMFKVLRNLSQQEDVEVRRRFVPFVEQMVQLIRAPGEAVTAELFVEVLGLLANLSLPEMDFRSLLSRHQLLPFLVDFLQPGAVEDDILLEVVIFIGTVASESTAPLLAAAGVVPALFTLMGAKRSDDELLLQLTYAFFKLLGHQPTREQLLTDTQVVLYFVDLLQDANSEVRRVADQCLDTAMDGGEEWALRIRNLKFEAYNQDWLQAAAGRGNIAAAFVGGLGDSGDDGSWGDGGYTMIGGQRVVDLDGFSGSRQMWDESGGVGHPEVGAGGVQLVDVGMGVGEVEGDDSLQRVHGEYGGGGAESGDYDDDELMRGYVV